MAPAEKPVGIVLVGCGTVGSAVAGLLVKDASVLRQKVKPPLALRAIVDLDFSRARAAGVDEAIFEKDLSQALALPGVDVVIELVGGTTFAREVIERALRAGKHVVTANKALLAQHGNELFALARAHGKAVLFEASVAGGIPIVRAVHDGLVANRIDALFGIVNGTCNYILTQMTELGRSYAEALAEAQSKGYAEKDPTLDVSGLDSAHKIAVLQAIAFGQPINLQAVDVEGIDRLALSDVRYGQELGYVIKLLAIAKREDGGIYTAVKPAFISRNHPLAWVGGPFNAVSVYGHATGHTMYYGRGAGGNPTASAIVADVVSVALANADNNFNKLLLWPDLSGGKPPLPRKEAHSRFYIRIMAADEPGVLAQIAAVLARERISISSVLQKERGDGGAEADMVPIVITTHKAKESAVKRALAEVDALPVISGTSVCISILEEHPEETP